MARANTAQILDGDPQVPAGLRFLLQLIQTKCIVNHHLEKPYRWGQAGTQLDQTDLPFPKVKANLF